MKFRYYYYSLHFRFLLLFHLSVKKTKKMSWERYFFYLMFNFTCFNLIVLPITRLAFLCHCSDHLFQMIRSFFVFNVFKGALEWNYFNGFIKGFLFILFFWGNISFEIKLKIFHVHSIITYRSSIISIDRIWCIAFFICGKEFWINVCMDM